MLSLKNLTDTFPFELFAFKWESSWKTLKTMQLLNFLKASLSIKLASNNSVDHGEPELEPWS